MVTKEVIESKVGQKYPDFHLSEETYKTIVEYQQMKKCSDEHILQNVEKIMEFSLKK